MALSDSAEITRCQATAHQYSFTWGQDENGQALRWQVEQEKPDQTSLIVTPDTLTMESGAGLTLWLDRPLAQTYRISFSREVLLDNHPYDRLSDVNLFWAAHDPLRAELFTRQGQLDEYDGLSLYYAGIGGNWNTTTRFRHYDGRGERTLLAEFTEPEKRLKPHHRYRMVIEVTLNSTQLWVDDQLWFSASYATPLAPGYFAFRTVWSRQIIRDFHLTQGRP